ncbi:MAG: hypothetical protein B7Z20_01865, partial [Sphingobium sp. 32-64-5]
LVGSKALSLNVEDELFLFVNGVLFSSERATSKLREEGLVATRKKAQTVYYRICDPRARRILALLHDIFCPELGRGPAKAQPIGDDQ